MSSVVQFIACDTKAAHYDEGCKFLQFNYCAPYSLINYFMLANKRESVCQETLNVQTIQHLTNGEKNIQPAMNL